MKVPRAIALALLWVGFAAYVWFSAAQLPERVATHFGVGGEPNGWMTRAGHVRFTLVAGVAIPAFVLGVFALVRYCGDAGLNIPHKAYWLAPERRQETIAFIQRQGVWFAAVMIVFLAGLHRSIVAANVRSPVSLPPGEVGWVAGGLIASSLIWAACFFVRFSRKPA